MIGLKTNRYGNVIGLLVFGTAIYFCLGVIRPVPHHRNQSTVHPQPTGAPTANQLQINQAYGKLPLYFEANEGQTDPQVRFLSRGSGYTLFITPREAVFVLKRGGSKDISPKTGRLGHKFQIPNSSLLTGSQDVLRLRLQGADPKAEWTGGEKMEGTANYFIGNDPSKWRTKVPLYAKVKAENVYPGIDMVYYGNPFDGAQGGGHGQLEYDFVVNPGADPSAIQLTYEGANEAKVDEQGNLVLKAPGGNVVFKSPGIYQEKEKIENGQWTIRKTIVEGRYVARGGHKIGFELGTYDKTCPLVIDPTLVYSTYLGGAHVDDGFGIAVDLNGSAYVTGLAGVGFPTTPGAYQTVFGGGSGIIPCDAFVTKLNPSGSALVYSTYLGGNGFDEGSAIVVDGSGNAYVVGSTSGGFPTTPGAYQTAYGGGGSNAFVAKLNAAGNSLVYSTYLGGSGLLYGESGQGIALDASGNIYVTGETSSTNFPTTAGAYQTAYGGGGGTFPSDSFVAKLNPAGGGGE